MADLGGMYAALMGQFGQDAARTVAVNQAGLDRVADSGNQLVQAIRAGRARMDALKQQERENALKERGMNLEEQLGGAKMGLMGAQTASVRDENTRAQEKQPLTLEGLRAGIDQTKSVTAGQESKNRVDVATEGERITKPALENSLLRAQTTTTESTGRMHDAQTQGVLTVNKFLPQTLQSEINARDASAVASRASAGLSGAHADHVREQIKQLQEERDPKSFQMVAKSYDQLMAGWKVRVQEAMNTNAPPPPMPSADDARDHLAQFRGENKIFHNGQPFSFDSEGMSKVGLSKIYKDGAGNGILVSPDGRKTFVRAQDLAGGVSSNSPAGLPPAARPSQPAPADGGQPLVSMENFRRSLGYDPNRSILGQLMPGSPFNEANRR